MDLGKYVKGTDVDAVVETGVFRVKVIESATNYVRSLRGIQILSGAIELVKWNAFWKVHNTNDFKNSIKAIKKIAKSLDEKDQQSCLNEQIKKETKALKQQFNAFLKHANRDLKYAVIGMVSSTYLSKLYFS